MKSHLPKGRFSKHDRRWFIAVDSRMKVPDDRIVNALKGDGSGKLVKLLKLAVRKPLEKTTLHLYEFAQLDDSLPSRKY